MSGLDEERERLLARYELELEADPGVRGALAGHRAASQCAHPAQARPSWSALLVSFVLFSLSAGAVIAGLRTGIWALTAAGVAVYALVLAPLTCRWLRLSSRRARRRSHRWTSSE